jgi:hypothetical protein
VGRLSHLQLTARSVGFLLIRQVAAAAARTPLTTGLHVTTLRLGMQPPTILRVTPVLPPRSARPTRVAGEPCASVVHAACMDVELSYTGGELAVCLQTHLHLSAAARCVPTGAWASGGWAGVFSFLTTTLRALVD